MWARDPSVRFEPIDVDAHGQLCIEFRHDSFVCSFGDARQFYDEVGDGGAAYLESLRRSAQQFPDGFVHVWSGDAIVGQMEMRVLDNPRRGYINLFYLRPEMRGSGLGDALQSHALAFMRQHAVTFAQLSVSPTNARALAYYAKHGWHSLGPRPGHEHVHLMQHEIP